MPNYRRYTTYPMSIESIPLGTSLFMPIINWLSIKDVDGNNDQELSIVAKKRMDIVSNLQLSINDYLVPLHLEKYRISSSSFLHAYFPPDNVFNVFPHGYRQLISDGYWIFLNH